MIFFGILNSNMIASQMIVPPTQCPEFNQHASYLVPNTRGATSRSEKILPALTKDLFGIGCHQ